MPRVRRGRGCGPRRRRSAWGARRCPRSWRSRSSASARRVAALALVGRDAAVADADPCASSATRTAFLARVGLGYLALDRAAPSLSGGESQRIRLAAQLGSNLRGACYVLDEPTIGLHVRDNARLLDALCDLRDRGNSLIVVEHDEDTIRRADHLIDMGPGGGREGGRVVAAGTPAEVASDPASPTGRLLARPPVPRRRSRGAPPGVLVVEGATEHNLKDVTVAFPLGRLTDVTGVSGSGKSTLVRDVLYEGVRAALGARRARAGRVPARSWARRPSSACSRSTRRRSARRRGRCPRRTWASGTTLRAAFSKTPEARARGWKPGRFSFNVKGGRCEACEGQGRVTVEMSFLPDVTVRCDDVRRRPLHGRDERGRAGTASRPSQVLALTFAEAAKVFAAFPAVAPFLTLMDDVGLGYLVARAARDDALGRRGAAPEARDRARQGRARGQDALRPRRADDGAPRRGRRPARRGPAAPRRPRRHGRRASSTTST